MSDAGDLNRVFHALADPTRRSILRQMARGEQTVTELARPYDLTFAAVSKHLKVLEAADLVCRRKRGSYQMISLNPEALKGADDWLRYYRQVWITRLEALKNLLEKETES